ncbi:hypothetical protein LTS17_003771 [Exophiala oligosperma]
MDKAPLHQEKAILDDHYAIRPTTVVAPEGPWDDVRKDIEELYLVQNLSLPEVMEEMENRGFTATERMYKARLKRWNIGKNATRADWLVFMQSYQERLEAGMNDTFMLIHNKIRRIQELRRYLRAHREDEDAFVAEAMASEIPIPGYMHLCHADGSLAETAPSTSLGPATLTQNEDPLNPAFTESYEMTAPDQQWREVPDLDMSGPRPASRTEESFSRPPANDHSRLRLSGPPENQVEFRHGCNIGESEQQLAGGSAAIVSTQPSAVKYDGPATISEQADRPTTYDSACMLACMFHAAGRREMGRQGLRQTVMLFRQMCLVKSPFVLTCASTMLTWMIVHAEGSIAGMVMSACWETAKDALGNQDPISTLLAWMIAATGGIEKMRACTVNTETLRHVWQTFQHRLGAEHPHTIVALYCLSFQLILADKLFAEAEEHLQRLSLISTKILGLAHLQTINVLATLSRAQGRQKKFLLALETIDQSLAAAVAPLGEYHPLRLELLIRKALTPETQPP